MAHGFSSYGNSNENYFIYRIANKILYLQNFRNSHQMAVVSTADECTLEDIFIHYAHWVLPVRPYHSPPRGTPTSWPRPAHHTSSGVAAEPRGQRSAAAGRRIGSRRAPGRSPGSAGEQEQLCSPRWSSAEPWSRSQGPETEAGMGICGKRCLTPAP